MGGGEYEAGEEVTWSMNPMASKESHSDGIMESEEGV